MQLSDCPSWIGKPRYFNMDTHIANIEQMINADEIDIALYMIDHPPSYYREFPDARLVELKRRLYQQLFDANAYIDCEVPCSIEELEKTIDTDVCYPRADLLAAEIKKLNQNIEIPFVYELAPGSGWLPIGLNKMGHRFDYYGQTLSQKMSDFLKLHIPYWTDKPKPAQKTIFVCYELLEHLKHPDDIAHSFYRTNIDFDMVCLSTPWNCWSGGMNNWQNRQLGHLRGWTSDDFLAFANRSFQNYTWKLHKHHTLVLVGHKVKLGEVSGDK